MSWFKNLVIYRLNRQFEHNAEELIKILSANAFVPCGNQDITKTGWSAPLGVASDMLVHAAGTHMLLCARKEEKILPASVIKKAWQNKIEELEKKQHRRLKKTEKSSLKEEVIYTLLPRAFSRFNQTYIWIDTGNNLIIVDSASSKRAEDALALLRKSLGSLPVMPLTFNNPIELTLTQWVKSHQLPKEFLLQDEAELKSTLTDGGVIVCKKQDLTDDEITYHIQAGKQVTKLALEWQEQIRFVLVYDGSLKRIKFTETLREQNADIDKEDIAQRLDADFVLMTGQLTLLIKDLIQAMGGEIEKKTN